MTDHASPTPRQPIRFDPSFERAEDGEAETTAELIDTLRGIATTTHEHSGEAVRSVHAKSHGLLVGELHIPNDLPPALAQGLFAKGGTYPVVMRLSSPAGDVLDDSVSLPRGLAIKVIGVDGARLPGSEGNVTQDFVMVNGPVFLKPDAKSFLKNLKLLAKTTDRAEPMKKALSAVLRGTEKVIEAFGGESGSVKAMGGHPETHILGETFFTQVPLLYGDHVAKLSVAPVSPTLTALTDATLDVDGEPDGLRDAVVSYFAANAAEWELRAQLNVDLDTMPIEDASIEWSQDDSPYVTIGRITAAPQDPWSDARVAAIDKGLSFAPWHGIAAHRPLGSIMRVRKTVYDTMARFRAQQDGRTVVEPKTIEELGL